MYQPHNSSAKDDPSEDLSAVVLATVGKEEANLKDMLRCIAQRMGSFGAGLWEVRDSKESKLSSSKYLMTVETWWNVSGLFAMDDVPLNDSPSGRVAVSQRGEIISDIRLEGGAKKNHGFWERNNVRGMCAVPIKYLDGNRGALNVYGQGSLKFTESDRMRLERIAALVPGLVRSVQERNGLHLVGKVEGLLRTAEGLKDSKTTKRDGKLAVRRTIRATLDIVCKDVSRTFGCVETSIFLKDSDSLHANKFKCMATTSARNFEKRQYILPKDRGTLTGWSLYNITGVQIPNLVHFQRDSHAIAQEYPGVDMSRHGDADIADARKFLELKADDDLPPLSFMAVPIFGGSDMYDEFFPRGVIRCYMAKSGPYYFSEKDMRLLSVVAAQIGEWWARSRKRVELEQENKAWNDMVQRLGRLNGFARQVLSGKNADEKLIFREALNLAAEIIPGADLTDIRLFDKGDNCLYFAQFSDFAEKSLQELGDTNAKARRFPVERRSKYAGVKAFQRKEVVDLEDVSTSKYYHEIFPQVKRMVIVPIQIDDEVFGVLDIRWTSSVIPPFAVRAAILLGQQLAMYHQLALLVSGQKELVARANQQRLAENNAIEDFSHQLRSPIAEAQMRVESAMELYPKESDRLPLYIVRGLFRRASRVAMNMRILSELSHGRELTLRRAPLDADNLLKKMIELANDCQVLNELRQIRFTVERSGFRSSVFNSILADWGMLEQMVSNLLDNAGKYSRRGSTVRIFAGVSNTGRHYLAVANRGLIFRPGEHEKCKARGWRSPEAKLIATEGRGIGLWLVNEIMKAHHGGLQIISPNQSLETEMRLVFTPQGSL